jgi:hypothetical protein
MPNGDALFDRTPRLQLKIGPDRQQFRTPRQPISSQFEQHFGPEKSKSCFIDHRTFASIAPAKRYFSDDSAPGLRISETLPRLLRPPRRAYNPLQKIAMGYYTDNLTENSRRLLWSYW